MRLFVCLIDSDGRGIPDAVRREHERVPRARGLAFEWQTFERMAVLIASDDLHRDLLVARDGDAAAVGVVRLDNRGYLAHRLLLHGCKPSDLDLALWTVQRFGTRHIAHLLGDFAFVIWDPRRGVAAAARDALGVKRLYYAQTAGLVAFASHAQALALEERYETQYLAEWVAPCAPSAELTVFAGVQAIPAGTLASVECGRVRLREYWSPDDFEPGPREAHAERQAIEACRELFSESVRLRLSDSGDTWAQLSGGLDSSSVASAAQWLAQRGVTPCGLAGTVTFVDRQGTDADEREYSAAVCQRWGLRNETILDPPFWLEDGAPLPRLDQPAQSLPFYPRDRRLCAMVRGAGGRALLTGFGGDELFTGTMLYWADHMARGALWGMARDMVQTAITERASVWRLAYRNALLPVLPAGLRQAIAPEAGAPVPWLARRLAGRYGLQKRSGVVALYGGRWGHKYRDALATSVRALSAALDCGLTSDALDVRHPFLYRPLVEFALQLPAELCVRPPLRKWVLREAMRDILPDAVRCRLGKGAANELLAQSLRTHRAVLEPLVRDSILADLGVVDPQRLRRAFDAAPSQAYRTGGLHATVQLTLILEAWLQMRSGRWPLREHYRRTQAPTQVHQPLLQGQLRRVI